MTGPHKQHLWIALKVGLIYMRGSTDSVSAG